MARTSRRETKFYTSQVLETINEAKYLIALYGRISVESEDKLERDSMGTQMVFLEDFAKTIDDSIIVDKYIDDDISGTSFDRPEYERLMQDVEDGKVNCIVVKDLSRFARDHIGAGEYLQKIFPEKGIRFIAITDNLDTLVDDGGIIVPIKNVINEIYAKDTSHKLLKHFKLMQKNGEFCSWKAPYGYVRSEEDKHKFMIDDEAADVVRRIFDMYAANETLSSIAKQFDKEGIPSPAQYGALHGAYQNDDAIKRRWTSDAVRKILANQSYLGHMVQNKFESLFLVTGKKDTRRENDKSDWIVVEDMHEAIIPEELFEIAQTRLEKNVEKRKELHQKYSHIPQKPTNLKSLIRCGCCGSSVAGARKFNARKEPVYYYLCPVHDKYGRKRCITKNVRREQLDKTVYFVIKRYMDSFLNMEKALDKLNSSSFVNNRIDQCKLELRNIRSEIQRVQKLKGELYEDLQTGMIDEADYTFFTEKYKADWNRLCEKENEASLLLVQLGSKDMEKSNLQDMVKKFANARKLSPEMAKAFIEQVVMNPDGTLEVTLKMKDEFDEFAKFIASRSGEEVAYAV